MGKQLYSQRYIYKIKSSRLRLNDWSLHINIDKARANDELIALGDSQILRFIRDITDKKYSEIEIRDVKKSIKILKKTKNNKENKLKIKELYENLDKMLLIDDYIAIVFDNKGDYNRAVKSQGFFINGRKFKRIIGTTGGVKKNTVMFCSEEIYEELNKRLENGRDEDIEIIPAKYEAYKALATSVSTPVTMPNKILVIKDAKVNIKDKVIKVYDDENGGFKIDYNFDYEAEKEFCDGCGMIRKDLADKWAIDLGLYKLNKNEEKIPLYTPSGFNTRYSFNKGMVFTFPFDEFASEIESYIVKDAWGKEVDIRDVDLVLTTNMLKLWQAYKSIDDYLMNCNENGYDFCVAKVISEKLESKRNMNYQYLQSYDDMTDDDIKELANETVTDIKDALGNDYIKSILFAKGIHINKKNIGNSDYDFIRALMIDERMINDTYVKQRIYNMIEKRIKQAKKGVLSVDGNYSVISGDLYALCESMFGLEIKGLLKFGEFYNGHWIEKGVSEVVAFRSPMTNHNNIRKLNFISNEKTNKWYRYMKNVTIFNSWDTTCDALNGADMDGDAIISTNNSVILRNTKNLPAIVCEQKSAEKSKIKESLLKKANKCGFGDEIGTITNRVTAMFDVLAKFEKDSLEYKRIMDRIICGQAYQQEAIDKIKGIEAKKMPKEWYDYRSNRIDGNESEEKLQEKIFNLKIMANKKPYFFIYNYDHLMNRYKKFKKDINSNSIIRFGKTIEELKKINIGEFKNEEEKLRIASFLEGANNQNPVFETNSTMNRIAKYIEDEFKDTRCKVKDLDGFDKDILKSNTGYDKKIEEQIRCLYSDYKRQQKQYIQTESKADKSYDRISKREMLIENFKRKASEICVNQDELCNIIIDMVYSSNNSKQFAWDVVGEQIIENLLNKNGRKYKYPILSKDGDIDWKGFKFKVVEEIICEE